MIKVFILLFLVSCSSTNNWQEESRSQLMTRLPTSDSTLREVSPNGLTALYEKSLGQTPTKWLSQPLPPNYHLPSSGPAKPYYNNSILWAMGGEGQVISGFRPVNTTTGCNSGCSPVMFHLKINERGEVTDLIEDPLELLRKKWHVAYTPKDKKIALELAQRIPRQLLKVAEPKLIADDKTVYPPQTWTAYKDLLVNESAYTSYRIIQASYQLKEFLQTNTMERNRIAQINKFVGQQLNGRWRNLSDLRKSFATLTKVLKHPQVHDSNKATIYSSSLRLLKLLVEHGTQNDLKNVEKFYSAPEFKTTHKSVVCEFKNGLLGFKKGNSLLVDMGKNPKQWPSCNSNLDKLYSLLGAAGAEKKELAQSWSQGMDLTKIPPALKKAPTLLELYSKLGDLLENREAKMNALANLKIRFPLVEIQENPEQSYLETAEKEYRKELKRAMLHADVDFPAMSVMSPEFGDEKLPKKGKQIYVFFATWCPHCKAKIKEWLSYPPSFWDKVALVEVFPRSEDPSRIQAFCKEIDLPSKFCNQIYVIKNDRERKKAYERLSLAGVPRTVITRPDMKVGFFDFKENHERGVDAQRDFQWVLEEVATRR